MCGVGVKLGLSGQCSRPSFSVFKIYLNQATPLVRIQIAKASVRPAAKLNAIVKWALSPA